MFGQRRRLRHVAAQVLLMWLFALGASIANACALEPELRHAATAASHDQHHAGPGSHHHDSHAGGHDHPSPHADKAPCAKFCDEPSAGAQTLKQQVDPSHEVWLACPPVNSLILDATPTLASSIAAHHELWRPAVPIPIAFLRLTL